MKNPTPANRTELKQCDLIDVPFGVDLWTFYGLSLFR